MKNTALSYIFFILVGLAALSGFTAFSKLNENHSTVQNAEGSSESGSLTQTVSAHDDTINSRTDGINISFPNTLTIVDKLSYEPSQSIMTGFVVVTDFGADPTGVSDSTDAIRDAVNSISSGTVFFPSGMYKVGGTIYLKSNIRIIGAGKETTFICPTLSSLGADLSGPDNGIKGVFSFDDATDYASDISIRDLSFDCVHFDDKDKLSCVCFLMRKRVDNLNVCNVAAIGAQSVVMTRGGENYYLQNISNDGEKKTVPYRCENILSFVGCQNIVVDGLKANDLVEIVDLSSCKDVIISNTIGHNSITMDNDDEAIDIGGSQSVIIQNLIADGYYCGVKLKEEGRGIKTGNIMIQNCQFTNFLAFGIQFLTNHELDDYVIEDIIIDNCVFETDAEKARGINNSSAPNNYGAKNVKISNCIFDCQTFAVAFSSSYDISISDCSFYGAAPYSVIMFSPGKDNVVKNNDKVCIEKCIFHTEASDQNTNYITCSRVSKCEIKNNKIYGSGNGRGICLIDLIEPVVHDNIIDSAQLGIYVVSTAHDKTHVIGTDIQSNIIDDCKTGIQVSYLGEESAEKTYIGLKVAGNTIKNTSVQPYGIRLSARNTPYGFDYISVEDNLVINTQTDVCFDQFVVGQHAKIENISCNSLA